jgi:hypothetical protein
VNLKNGLCHADTCKEKRRKAGKEERQEMYTGRMDEAQGC